MRSSMHDAQTVLARTLHGHACVVLVRQQPAPPFIMWLKRSLYDKRGSLRRLSV